MSKTYGSAPACVERVPNSETIHRFRVQLQGEAKDEKGVWGHEETKEVLGKVQPAGDVATPTALKGREEEERALTD